ncbi:ribosomal protein L6 [Obba rivulosa]|uniref:Ribosomal protein L6 n=1 Tax=Obba rivulosa TaxID=1052685 RepID=A0A8E2AVM7_9APHY|nr:ribosomal protein L6 [Obba rivulosa]
MATLRVLQQLRHAARLHPLVPAVPAVSAAHYHTSHIGKQPIPIPPSVTLTPDPAGTHLAVAGPLGTTSVRIEPYMNLAHPTPATLALTVQDPSEKRQRSMWGLTRTLIANAITGMSEGFSTPLYLVGVGYRAALEPDPRGANEAEGRSGQRLNMKLGFSHSVYVPVPPHIKVEVPLPTKIMLSCTDKHQLGLFAAKVRQWRPPEPYKGKGIFVGDERVRIKTVKKK